MRGFFGTILKWGLQATAWAFSFKLESMIYDKMKKSAETYGLFKS
jgi:hypothetical protein